MTEVLKPRVALGLSTEAKQGLEDLFFFCNPSAYNQRMGSKRPQRRKKPVLDRLISKVQKVGDCWIWVGSRLKNGYGHVGINYRTVLAHRAMYQEMVGDIPAGLEVCHHCDNRACVNPRHLFLGTHAENMADAASKGRISHGAGHYMVVRPRYGENCPASKLRAPQVEEIRSLLAGGQMSQREIGERFGVSQTAVSKIKLGVRWKSSQEE